MSKSALNSVEDALAAIAEGEMVVVVDDEDRENEGDLIMAASKASPEKVAFMVRHTSGILCIPMEKSRAQALRLDPMVHDNDAPLSTAFTISVDYRKGLTTGISAEERSNTALALSNSNADAEDFVRPGHLFPLISRNGGVLTRSGHTEAGVDLARLANCPPVGLLAEIVNDDGTVKTLPQLLIFAKEHQLKIISVADLIAYRQLRERLVEVLHSTTINTAIGIAQVKVYQAQFDHTLQHLALVFGEISGKEPVLTRIHRERIFDDVFGSQLGHNDNLVQAALKRIGQKKRGIFIYLRQHGPDDSDEASSEQQRLVQWKEVGIGAQILRDLGVSSIRLLSGRQRQYIGLKGFGIEIAESEVIPEPGDSSN